MRLGNVYSDLATNDNSLENGDRAVEAYRASLQVNTIEQDFGEWTHLQFYTFNVLLRIGVAHEDVPRLTDARDTAQAAVEVFQQRGDATDAESFEKALPLLDQAIALFAQESNPPSATQ
jgi:tetratricopeptide (TPR) repeat protein